VTEDGGCGVAVRRREQYFTFDAEVYRAWSGRTSVWLDDNPDDGSNGSKLQQNSSSCCQQEIGRSGEDSGKTVRYIGRDLYMYLYVQQKRGTESMDDETPGSGGGACVLRTAANDPANSAYPGGSVDRGQNLAALMAASAATVLPPCCQQSTPPTISPPGRKGRARARVYGRRPTSRVLRGGGFYLCYDCLKKARRPAKIIPLPGVLERSEENL